MARQFSKEELSEFIGPLRSELDKVAVSTDCRAQAGIQTEVKDVLASIVGTLEESEDLDPRSILNAGLRGLTATDQEAFLMTNLLEAVKSNKSLTKTVEKYRELGLTKVNVTKAAPNFDPKATREPTGKGLMRLRNLLSRFAIRLFTIVTRALEKLGGACAANPSVGFVGGVPSFSFELDLGSHGVDDFLDILADSR